MPHSEKNIRLLSLLLYAIVLVALQIFLIKPDVWNDTQSIWLLNGAAGLLFGSRLLNPYFTPPADATTNAFIAAATIAAGTAGIANDPNSWLISWILIVVFLLLGFMGITSIYARSGPVDSLPAWNRVLDRLVRRIGNPKVVYTVVIAACVWMFHRTSQLEMFAILVCWTTIIAFAPFEALLRLINWSIEQTSTSIDFDYFGTVVGFQTPNLVLVRQIGSANISSGTPFLIRDDGGPDRLGIALNYVGRDEGRLLRLLSIEFPTSLRKFVPDSLELPSNVAFRIEIDPDDTPDIAVLQWIDRLRGIVDSDTDLSRLQSEIIDERDLSEGRLLQTRIGEEWAYYQIIDGITHEDVVKQKNKYGYARASARKIGKWNTDSQKFEPISWIPMLNSPVFLVPEENTPMGRDKIGHFPKTSFAVSINTSDIVTHNTAILGILGVGKSYLAIEIVERILADNNKVICLDLTDQYRTELEEFINEDYHSSFITRLAKSGEGGQVNQTKELGGSHVNFKNVATELVREFMSPVNGSKLLILNPAKFEATKQTSGAYNGQAGMANLSACEITSIISDAALTVCQEMGMIDRSRLCLVYEEAHTLVPEYHSVGEDGDKTATARTSRAILQGRKFGLGCLLITQRTANVTKTILNQCNTIFAMRTFDETGMNFLANYIGKEYASVLPSMTERHAVLFGKASSCENPVLLRLNDREKFAEAFRAEAPPVRPFYANNIGGGEDDNNAANQGPHLHQL